MILSEFVNSSINEVARTLFEALAIVTLVVFAFLGWLSLRGYLPVAPIPLSLVGTFAMMLGLRLLGEPADPAGAGTRHRAGGGRRHHRRGKRQPTSGRGHGAGGTQSLRAARDLASPIIAMTIVLVAVYVPIGFQCWLTVALFTEFAFTLVGAVTVSAVVRTHAVADDALPPAAAPTRWASAACRRDLPPVSTAISDGWNAAMNAPCAAASRPFPSP